LSISTTGGGGGVGPARQWRAEIWGKNWGDAPANVQEDLQEFGRLSRAGLSWAEARDLLAEWWPVPVVVAALGEAQEEEPFELEVELGGVPGEVARWLNPLVLSVLRCEWLRA